MEFINWVCDVETNNGLIKKSQSVIENREISSDDISQKLAEGGILPNVWNANYCKKFVSRHQQTVRTSFN
ncbi:MAG: hypothetical protein IPF91_14170 [Saprospiraceae bacterium]|nr:hypothetical protein [Candidatus Brachybacter algidus]